MPPFTVTAPDEAETRPLRADAVRNRASLIAAAREAFAKDRTSTSLEDVPHRAGVGIGTLYRHFPTRVELLEAVYVEEVETLCGSAAGLADLPPWEALVGWLDRFVSYVATKQALAAALFAHLGENAEGFSQLPRGRLRQRRTAARAGTAGWRGTS
jgi:AcrR family transcriptional regulator